MSTLFVNVHFIGFKVVELFANRGFVFWCQPGPGFVCPSIIFMAGCHLNVVAKLDYLQNSVHFSV